MNCIATPLVNRTHLPSLVRKPFSNHQQRRSWSDPAGWDSAALNPILSAVANGNRMLHIMESGVLAMLDRCHCVHAGVSVIPVCWQMIHGCKVGCRFVSSIVRG